MWASSLASAFEIGVLNNVATGVPACRSASFRTTGTGGTVATRKAHISGFTRPTLAELALISIARSPERPQADCLQQGHKPPLRPKVIGDQCRQLACERVWGWAFVQVLAELGLDFDRASREPGASASGLPATGDMPRFGTETTPCPNCPRVERLARVEVRLLRCIVSRPEFSCIHIA
jgi:hypothetical protein